MAQKIVVDPITRIEGHLAIEVEVEGGVVKDAKCKGTLFRGLEIICQGKDPRDAAVLTSRSCGVCPAEHAHASVQQLDMAFGAEVPDNGRIIRNLVAGSNFIASHILHFYHLTALDYLDIMAIAQYNGADPALLKVRDKVVALVKAGDTAPFTPRYNPDQFSVADPTVVTTAVHHYIQALEMRKKAQEMLAIFGGKMPHHVTYVAGGVTIQPTPDRIAAFRSRLLELIDFINNVYLKDVLYFGTGPLKPLHDMKVGAGCGNFLSYGNFDLGKSGDFNNRFLKAGAIFNGDLTKVNPLDPDKIHEEVKYSWYENTTTGKHPYEGETKPDAKKEGAYSWLKAPRYDGKPMEVGPLARQLVTQEKGFMDLVNKLGAWPSAVARHAARAWECKLIAEAMLKWVGELKPGEPVCNEKPVPEKGRGMGLVEAARGALGHFGVIENYKIRNYQMVVPTTWNCSPADDEGVKGPVEQALIGAPVPDPENPINLVRIVRSFDPCVACAVHLIHPDTNEIKKFRVV
ncbi:nickel-dependent hydrogenase large subunit [Thermincola ferriacetica]|uniref:Nickel-dependent hydrogenase large subunit n=1 Tax=Thermincola ferriacetica TaxID=281456 RepID=A0A0L6W1Q0_9FIRM|nr:nickel-dependent hydrogenase large subunit [Thermincola ferriacetica]KNZ68999.1 nickel-dependent hydrogenase large subunit [Thermincola ferriacetica]